MAVRFRKTATSIRASGSGGVRSLRARLFPGRGQASGTAIDLRPDGRIWVAGWTDVGLVSDPLYQPFVFLLT
ncbi:MAG: hypothetical protein R2862_01120 [Thermoanaerobaculia bacterium]